MTAHTSRVSHLAIVGTGFSAFILSLGWYSSVLFGPIWLKYSHADPSAMPLWKAALAPIRELIVAYVLAQLLARLDIREWRNAVMLGLGLWFAFFGVSLAGAVLWDNMPWELGAVHAGDWFMKMLFMALVLCAWHRSRGALTSSA